jgi:hypothetical protein
MLVQRNWVPNRVLVGVSELEVRVRDWIIG